MKKLLLDKNIELIQILRPIAVASILLLDVKVGDYRIFPPLSSILSLLTIFTLSIWWLWKIKSNIGIPRNPITLPLVILIGVAVISTIFSVDPRRSLDGLLAILTIVLIFFLICDLLISKWKVETFEHALLIFVSGLLILGLREIFNWYLGWYNIGVPEYPLFLLRYRLYGVTAHPNPFAMLINLTLPFVILRFARARSKFIRLFWIIWIIIATIVFYFANSRGGMIATSFVLLITIGMLLLEKGIPNIGNFKGWIWKNRGIFGSLIAFLTVFISLELLFQTISPYKGSLHHGGGISTGGGRWTFWQVALDMFLYNPLTGGGLFTYPRFYLEAQPSGLNGWLAPHAHNLYFDFASQLGILGLLILIWICITLFISYIKIIRQKGYLKVGFVDWNKDLIIGSFAALIGFSIHSLFDDLITSPHTIIPIFILIAIGLSSMGLIKPGKRINSRFIPISIGFLFIIIVTIFTYQQDFAHWAQINSRISSNDDNWKETAQYLEQAVFLDPKLLYYQEQIGYAYGVLAEIEYSEEPLNKAIESLTISIQNQPFWAPNYVNLATLLDQKGEHEVALHTLERIPAKWLNVWYLPAFMLAERYQAKGEIDKAADLFSVGLRNRSWLKDITICRASYICQNVASQISTSNEIDHVHNEAIKLLEIGKPEDALRSLERLPYEEIPSLIWIDLANANIALGNFERAQYELLIASQLATTRSDETRSYMALVVSDLLTKTKQFDAAIVVLENTVKPSNIERYYDYFLFHRVGFPENLLPSVNMLIKSDYDRLIFEKLSALYKLEGRYSDAKWAKEEAEEISKILDRN